MLIFRKQVTTKLRLVLFCSGLASIRMPRLQTIALFLPFYDVGAITDETLFLYSFSMLLFYSLHPLCLALFKAALGSRQPRAMATPRPTIPWMCNRKNQRALVALRKYLAARLSRSRCLSPNRRLSQVSFPGKSAHDQIQKMNSICRSKSAVSFGIATLNVAF